MIRPYKFLAIAISGGIALAGTASAQMRVPSRIDPGAKVLIYLHGAWLERRSQSRRHPRYGVTYDLRAIVAAFQARGFVVISEHRSRVRVRGYARQVAGVVNRLISRGVPGRNITVAGHSRGGVIAMVTSAMVRNFAVRYVVLAGCVNPNFRLGQGFRRFASRGAHLMRGRILSVYDPSDRLAGSCRSYIRSGRGRLFREVRLNTGHGHGLFYQPRASWVGQVARWAR